MTDTPHLLITAGPTHEPIDAVRFIGNRSSGRLGVALADAAAGLGWTVTLLLGPTPRRPSHGAVRVLSYQSCADLEALLERHFPACDVLVMAAAVSDYRSAAGEAEADGKRRRTGKDLVLRLESTPDLLAGCANRRREGQLLVGFALEPRERLLESARAKLVRKGIDMIVANPLETMDADTIEASVLIADDPDADGPIRRTPPGTPKDEFAGWLLEQIRAALPATAVGRGTP